MATRVKVSAVYAIRNRKTEKRYVGSAVDFVRRMQAHKEMLRCGTHHCRHLQAAYNMYGAEAFVFSILERCNPVELLKREQYYIDITPSGCLYNTCMVAGSCLGVKRTQTTRDRLSEALKGRTFSASHRQNLSAALVGRTVIHSEKTKQKISVRAKQVANSEEGRRLRSERAKQMHAEGRITYHQKVTSKPRICTNCGITFINSLKPNGKLAQRKLCKKCKAAYTPPGPGPFNHTEEAKRRISEAARRMWAAKKGG